MVGLILLMASGCSLSGGTLGGREKCWPESDPRAPSLWRGILQIDASGARLATSEGDDIPLLSRGPIVVPAAAAHDEAEGRFRRGVGP